MQNLIEIEFNEQEEIITYYLDIEDSEQESIKASKLDIVNFIGFEKRERLGEIEILTGVEDTFNGEHNEVDEWEAISDWTPDIKILTKYINDKIKQK